MAKKTETTPEPPKDDFTPLKAKLKAQGYDLSLIHI